MNWLILAILSAFLYGGYNFFLKLSSGHIHQILGAVILQFSALLIGLLLLFFLRSSGEQLEFSRLGITFAILAGGCAAFAEITTLYVFSRGVPAALGVPIIVGGTVAAGTILGLVFLRESLTFWQWLGLAFVVLGIFLLSSKEPYLTRSDDSLVLSAVNL